MRSTALPWAVGSVLFPAAFSNNCPSTDGSVRQIGAPRLDAGYFFSTANGRGGGCARLGCRGNMGVPGFGGSERMVSSHAEILAVQIATRSTDWFASRRSLSHRMAG